MHDARHAENVLRQNYREAKRKANEFRIEAMALCTEKEKWIFERAKLEKQRDSLLSICEELQESAEYWSEYFVPLGIVERLDAAIASVKGSAA